MFRFGCSTSAHNYGSLMLVRGIRMKGKNKLLSRNSQKEKEEDIFLERLEAQYARLKSKLSKEDEEKRKAGTDRMHLAPKPEAAPKPATASPLANHNLSLWDRVVSVEDQAKLQAHGIKSMDELQEAYQEADADLNRPPYPAVQRLRPRLRLAYELYKTIPKKLASKRPS